MYKSTYISLFYPAIFFRTDSIQTIYFGDALRNCSYYYIITHDDKSLLD